MDESEVLKFEQEIAPMKPSTAIRIGAKFRPQCTRYPLRGDGKSCAMGAAYEGATGKTTNDYIVIFDLFPILGQLRTDIWTMNDAQGKTREEIADWLEAQGH